MISMNPVVWRDKSGDSWSVVLHLTLLRGRMECVGFEILSYQAGETDELRPVTASSLRQFPLGEIVSTELGKMFEMSSVVVDFDEERLEAAKTTTARRGGRKGHGPEHYAEVAQVYSNVWAQGGHPTKAVAERWDVARGTAAKWVFRARELGLLELTTKGRAGGVHVEAITVEERD